MMSELVKTRRRMLEWLKLAKRWTPFTVFNVTGPSYEPLDEVLTASINRTLGIFLKAPIENFPPPLAPKLLSPKATGSLHNSGIVFSHLFKEHSFPSFLLSNMSLEDNKKPTLYPQKLTLNAEANSTAYGVPTPLGLVHPLWWLRSMHFPSSFLEHLSQLSTCLMLPYSEARKTITSLVRSTLTHPLDEAQQTTTTHWSFIPAPSPCVALDLKIPSWFTNFCIISSSLTGMSAPWDLFWQICYNLLNAWKQFFAWQNERRNKWWNA